MIFRKYIINQKKFKIFLLLINFILITLTLIFIKFDKPIAEQVPVHTKYVQNDNINTQYDSVTDGQNQFDQNQNQNEDEQLQLRLQQSPLVPEKYNEYNVKQRLMKDKIKYLTEVKNINDDENDKIIELKKNTPHIHIFYNLPVSWYKDDSSGQKIISMENIKEQFNNITISTLSSNTYRTNNIINNNNNNNKNQNSISSTKTINKSIVDTAFYPLRGPYKQDNRVLREHLNSICNAGIGVLVIELNSNNALRVKLLEKLFKLVPKYNVSITFEININRNRTVEYLNEILNTLKVYINKNSFYKTYSIVKKKYLPLIYVVDAYKIQIPENKPTPCIKKLMNVEDSNNEIILIAHIRFKEHTDIVKRYCFDGFYSKIPSNGAFYASTWKNWSYLSRYARLNQMIFIPTVGPGYMQRKIPRHGGFEKDRSNGKYYGFAWSTAISQNPQFISIASFNNWRDGTQIEEAGIKTGYMNYLPAKPTKYLHLTAHWVNNYIKIKEKNQQTYNKCHNLFNNTIC